MARAQFQKGQKVWVESVGAWAHIDRIQPVWAKGFDEPVRVTYDVGLGREFMGHELLLPSDDPKAEATANWRLMRARNKWQTPEDCAQHPFPGTYPVVVTDKADWGGWRVPGAEYDRDPEQIEFQARLIAAAPRLMALAARMVEAATERAEDVPPEMMEMARDARRILKSVTDLLASPDPATAASETHSAAKAA
jgi:hypothetical protein